MPEHAWPQVCGRSTLASLRHLFHVRKKLGEKWKWIMHTQMCSIKHPWYQLYSERKGVTKTFMERKNAVSSALLYDNKKEKRNRIAPISLGIPYNVKPSQVAFHDGDGFSPKCNFTRNITYSIGHIPYYLKAFVFHCILLSLGAIWRANKQTCN